MKFMVTGMKALGSTFVNLFRSPVTESIRLSETRATRYRASFALLHDDNGEELCIGCKMCQKICPSDIIRVTQGPKRESEFTGKKRGWASDFTLDLQACIICELCVQVCPTDAIVMLREQEKPGFSREDLFLTMERLYDNETAKPRTWGIGRSLIEMQNPKRGLEE